MLTQTHLTQRGRGLTEMGVGVEAHTTAGTYLGHRASTWQSRDSNQILESRSHTVSQ